MKWYDLIYYMKCDMIYDMKWYMIYDMKWYDIWYEMIYDMIWNGMIYDIFVLLLLGWHPVTVVQYTFTQNNTQDNRMKQNTQNRTYVKLILYINMKWFFVRFCLFVCTLYKSTFLNRSQPNFASVSPFVWRRL
jgi:membrane protein required for beta-lactamase induction